MGEIGPPKGNSNGVQFGAGQDPTKGGRPKLSDRERSVRDSTRLQIAESIEKFQLMSQNDLERFFVNKNNKGFELGIASAYLESIKTGDFGKIDKIFDRTLGKSKNIIEHQGLEVSDIRDDSVRELAILHGLVYRGDDPVSKEEKEETLDDVGDK